LLSSKLIKTDFVAEIHKKSENRVEDKEGFVYEKVNKIVPENRFDVVVIGGGQAGQLATARHISERPLLLPSPVSSAC
jgi:hypothetical protein